MMTIEDLLYSPNLVTRDSQASMFKHILAMPTHEMGMRSLVNTRGTDRSPGLIDQSLNATAIIRMT